MLQVAKSLTFQGQFLFENVSLLIASVGFFQRRPTLYSDFCIAELLSLVKCPVESLGFSESV